MKRYLILMLFSTSLMAADFALQPQCTANGFGRMVFLFPNSCVYNSANLDICNNSVQNAMQIMMRKSAIIGQKIYLLAWTSNEQIIQAYSPEFNCSDPCFQQNRSKILQFPSHYKCHTFHFLNKNKECIGKGIFIGPTKNGPCDPNNQLHTYAQADGSL